jgi:sulfur carrier protein
MEVDVSLFATFKIGRFARQRVVLPEKATTSDLVELLKINPDEVGIIVVNQRDATLNQALTDGDRVTLLPVIGGG